MGRPVTSRPATMSREHRAGRRVTVAPDCLVKSINNSILVILGLILLVAVHGGQSLRPFGVNINVRDVRGQRPPFIMPRFDVLGLRRLRDLKQSNQESPDSDSEIVSELVQPAY